MKKESHSVENAVIHSVGGIPNKSDSKDASLFQMFKRILIPRLKKQEELTISYEEATVCKAHAEAEKIIQEGAKLAAETEKLEIECNIARQNELRQFQENVERTFIPGDSPEVAALKFAKLLETNPSIAAQLERVNAIRERLASSKNCQITFQNSHNQVGGNATDGESPGR